MGLLFCAAQDSSLVTKIGGGPTDVASFEWPCCQSCNGAMQFIAQVGLAETEIDELNGREQALLVFQCQNEPGMCDDWDADGGGNAALLVGVDRGTRIEPPSSGETKLPSESLVSLKRYDSSVTAETDDDNYVTALDNDQNVLGKIGGTPLWVQDDETPECACGSMMVFVAMIDERAGGGINFGGGGVGYAFVCTECQDRAKFLWQC